METAHEFAISEAQFAFEQHVILPELERFGWNSVFAAVRFQRADSNGALAALISNKSTRMNLARLMERVQDTPLRVYLKWIESIRVTNVS